MSLGYYKFKLADGKWRFTGLVKCATMNKLRANNPQLDVTCLAKNVKYKEQIRTDV